jgi:formylglycine-generating enzyme required for sulfatase activity
MILLGVLLLAMLAGALWLLRDPQPTTGQAEPVASETPLPDAATDNAAEAARWQAALDADTVFGFRRFLADYPDSRFKAQAQLQLDILDDRAWQELSAENSLPAYHDYLERFPNGRHQAEAMGLIESMEQAASQAERELSEQQRLERAAWQAAQAAGSIAALQHYLEHWPASDHADQARQMLRSAQDRANDDGAWAAAQSLGSKDALQGYIDAFPAGAHVTAALQAMDHATLRPGKRFRDCPDCPEMLVLPAGSFQQGSEDPAASPAEQPLREVAIARPFAIGVFEVTLAQWDACQAAGGCAQALSDNGWGRGLRPAIMVSWEDAQQYIAWLAETTGQGYRLPSESEWEYAARAGARGDWPASGPTGICAQANLAGTETDFEWRHPDCGDTLALGTAPAGTFEANTFGLYDMIGNVAEWTADCWNLSYLDAPADGSAWTRGICSSHVTRGGSWVTGSREARLPARFNLRAGDRNDFTGFRVARDLRD